MSPAGSQLKPPGLRSVSSLLKSFYSFKFSAENSPKERIHLYGNKTHEFFQLNHFRHQNLPVPNTHKKILSEANSLLWRVNSWSRQTGQQLAEQHLGPLPRWFTGLWRLYFLQISYIVKRERKKIQWIVTYRNIQPLQTLFLSNVFWVRLFQIVYSTLTWSLVLFIAWALTM